MTTKPVRGEPPVLAGATQLTTTERANGAVAAATTPAGAPGMTGMTTGGPGSGADVVAVAVPAPPGPLLLVATTDTVYWVDADNPENT